MGKNDETQMDFDIQLYHLYIRMNFIFDVHMGGMTSHWNKKVALINMM